MELGGELQGLGWGCGNEEWGRKGKDGRGEVCVWGGVWGGANGAGGE